MLNSFEKVVDGMGQLILMGIGLGALCAIPSFLLGFVLGRHRGRAAAMAGRHPEG